MNKPKILFILHCSPPPHGAAKVGDVIATNSKLVSLFECSFIKIKSSETIDEIGKVSFKKLYLAIGLFIKICFALVMFRPDKIYFTASNKGIAFFRDLLLSLLWKTYCFFKPIDIYYHYHTKGINSLVSESKLHLFLAQFFLKNVKLILLSNLLSVDFKKINTYEKVFILPNGVEDPFSKKSFTRNLDEKYENINRIQVLYLSQMTKEKGYDEVLDLALRSKNSNIHYHFAGNWQSQEDEEYFHRFIRKHTLEARVTYHGFVDGRAKDNLFKLSHLLAYPSRNDAFPLTIIEALSYGVPVIATNEGSIPFILDANSGIVVDYPENFLKEFEKLQLKLINRETAHYCYSRYIKEFTLEKFESNLVGIFND